MRSEIKPVRIPLTPQRPREPKPKQQPETPNLARNYLTGHDPVRPIDAVDKK